LEWPNSFVDTNYVCQVSLVMYYIYIPVVNLSPVVRLNSLFVLPYTPDFS